MDLKKLYINGQWVAPLSAQYIEVENPADKSVFATVAAAGADDPHTGCLGGIGPMMLLRLPRPRPLLSRPGRLCRWKTASRI